MVVRLSRADLLTNGADGDTFGNFVLRVTGAGKALIQQDSMSQVEQDTAINKLKADHPDMSAALSAAAASGRMTAANITAIQSDINSRQAANPQASLTAAWNGTTNTISITDDVATTPTAIALSGQLLTLNQLNWQVLGATALNLGAVETALKRNITSATPAGTITIDTLTSADVGKEIALFNISSAARVFTPGVPTTDASGAAILSWNVAPGKIWTGEIVDIGGTPTLRQFPITDSAEVVYKTSGAVSDNYKVNAYNTAAEVGAAPAIASNGFYSTFELDTGALKSYVANSAGTAWVAVESAEAKPWVASTNGMTLANGDRVIVANGHSLSLPSTTNLDEVTLAPATNWGDYAASGATITPDAAWTVGNGQTLMAGRSVVRFVADAANTNWRVFD